MDTFAILHELDERITNMNDQEMQKLREILEKHALSHFISTKICPTTPPARKPSTKPPSVRREYMFAKYVGGPKRILET